MLCEDDPPFFGLHVDDERCRKSTDCGREADERVLRDDGSVDELYDDEEFEDGNVEGDRSSDGDFVVWADRLEGDDRRIHRRRLSQSLSRPWDTLISCSFRTRKDGRTSGQWAQHFRITS